MSYSYKEKEKMVLEYNKKKRGANIIFMMIMVAVFTVIAGICFGMDMNVIGGIIFAIDIIFLITYSIIIECNTNKYLKENGITKEEFKEILLNNLPGNQNTKTRITDKDCLPGFTPNYKIGSFLSFDDNSRKFAIYTGGLFSSISKIVNYDDLIDVNIIQDNESLITGGLASSLVGGVMLGGAGLIAGAVIGKKNKIYCENLSIKLTINNNSSPCEIIELIPIKVKTDSSIYKEMCQIAEEAISKFKVILTQNSKGSAIYDNEKDIPNLIKQYKELYDQGLITEEEYNEKKKRLLHL